MDQNKGKRKKGEEKMGEGGRGMTLQGRRMMEVKEQVQYNGWEKRLKRFGG